MATNQRAKDYAAILFDELTSPARSAPDRWARVTRLVGEEESLHLDFKSIRTPVVADLAHERYIVDKLARSLSGFANMAGGLLLYGVQTSKRKAGEPERPDRAERVAEFADVARVRATLEQLASMVIEPPIGRVDIREIENPSNPGFGIVAVWVPESVGAPHRVTGHVSPEIKENYFMRTTTQVVVMPHKTLAGMFARTAPPLLQLKVKVGALSPPDFTLSFLNKGRGTARRPAAILRGRIMNGTSVSLLNWGGQFPRQDGVTGFVVRAVPYGAANLEAVLIEPYENLVVYPGADRAMCTLETRAGLDDSVPIVLELSAELYALDMQPVIASGSLRVGAWDGTSLEPWNQELILGREEGA